MIHLGEVRINCDNEERTPESHLVLVHFCPCPRLTPFSWVQHFLHVISTSCLCYVTLRLIENTIKISRCGFRVFLIGKWLCALRFHDKLYLEE